MEIEHWNGMVEKGKEGKGKGRNGGNKTEGDEDSKRVRKKKDLADFEVNFFKKIFVMDKDFLAAVFPFWSH